jgi:hypothetical protein
MGSYGNYSTTTTPRYDNDPAANSASRAANEAQSTHNQRIAGIVNQIDAQAHAAAAREETKINIDTFVDYKKLKEPYEKTEIVDALKARGYTVDDHYGYGATEVSFPKVFGQPKP